MGEKRTLRNRPSLPKKRSLPWPLVLVAKRRNAAVTSSKMMQIDQLPSARVLSDY